MGWRWGERRRAADERRLLRRPTSDKPTEQSSSANATNAADSQQHNPSATDKLLPTTQQRGRQTWECDIGRRRSSSRRSLSASPLCHATIPLLRTPPAFSTRRSEGGNQHHSRSSAIMSLLSQPTRLSLAARFVLLLAMLLSFLASMRRCAAHALEAEEEEDDDSFDVAATDEPYTLSEDPAARAELSPLDAAVVWILTHHTEFWLLLGCVLLPLFALAGVSALLMLRSLQQESARQAQQQLEDDRPQRRGATVSVHKIGKAAASASAANKHKQQ